MRYATVCSGIEAPSSGWDALGWKPVFFSEIEPFPSAVLAHHYPDVPNHGDMTKFKEWPDYELELICGGTPCQSFSVAGLRKGLDDPRGNLMLTYLAIAARYRPRWLVWENVPGVLSSGGGNDFASLLRGMGELGYGFAYRVLDAQYFGVPQRRRRVFVVGHLGDWRRAAAVLFECHSLQGHPAPRRETGKGLTPGVSGRAAFGGNNTSGSIEVATACQAHGGPQGRINFESETFIAIQNATRGKDQNGLGIAESGDPMFTLDQGSQHAVAFDSRQDCISSDEHFGSLGSSSPQAQAVCAAFKGGQGSAAGGIGYDEHVAPTLGASPSGSNRTPALMQAMQVRRLTPRECERLQGFADDYTLINVRNKPAADGPRYKALGNSMAVPVLRWIGERIEMVAAA